MKAVTPQTSQPLVPREQATFAVAPVYMALLVLTILGRFVAGVSYLVYIAAIAFPLAVTARTRDWQSIGITRRNWKPALCVGLAAGILISSTTLLLLAALHQVNPPVDLFGQLLIAVPAAFVVISPFQELLFRGWMQPRLQRALGAGWGLVLCALLFAVWDALPRLKGVPLAAALGTWVQLVPFSLGFAMVIGAIYYWVGNLIAPWLAHAIAVISLVFAGRFLPLGK